MAKSGKGWVMPLSLQAMEAEANRIAPKRSKASDGSIGDAAHRARKSDHNPSGRYIHAIDLTHDPKNGFDVHAHARNVAARHDSRIEYIISNGYIAERSNGFRWVKYNGDNPHNKHAHFSIRHTATARFDTSPWFNATITFPTPVPPPVPSVPPKPQPKPTPAPTPTPAPAPQPQPQPAPVFPTPTKDEDEMKVFRDHTGAIWMIYSSGKRKHIPVPGEAEALSKINQYIDLGPGSMFYNPIISQVMLNYTKEISGVDQI